ncbi:type IX secretion system protein PorG [Parapedobacter sp.]
MNRIATLLLMLQLPLIAAAQEWELGLQGGASGYMGDINPENPLAFNEWAAGASVKYNLDDTWGIRGNFAYANTYGHDTHSRVQQRRNRNLGFFGPIMEAAVLVDFNFFKWLPQRGRIVYTPYIFAGIGVVAFDPKWYLTAADGSRETVSLREMRTEYHVTDNPDMYEQFTYSIPFGAGFKYNLRGPWSVGIELAYRLTLTDYLDDVSGNYPDVSPTSPIVPFLPAGRSVSDWEYLSYRGSPNAVPYTQRGDGRPYDSFMTVGITLSYTIFKGGCPEWQ